MGMGTHGQMEEELLTGDLLRQKPFAKRLKDFSSL
jgi:hypothetical protein